MRPPPRQALRFEVALHNSGRSTARNALHVQRRILNLGVAAAQDSGIRGCRDGGAAGPPALTGPETSDGGRPTDVECGPFNLRLVSLRANRWLWTQIAASRDRRQERRRGQALGARFASRRSLNDACPLIIVLRRSLGIEFSPLLKAPTPQRRFPVAETSSTIPGRRRVGRVWRP